MKDFFLRTYQKKSDAELEKIADAKGDYEMSAREAAIEILAERNGEVLESSIRKAEIESEKETILARKKLYGNQLPEGLHMYSEVVVLLFTFFFSSLAGGIMLYINFKELKKAEQANTALSIGLLFFVLGTGGYFLLDELHEIAKINRLIAIAVFSQYFWTKHIGREIEFYRKSWLPPLFLALGIILVESVLITTILNKILNG